MDYPDYGKAVGESAHVFLNTPFGRQAGGEYRVSRKGRKQEALAETGEAMTTEANERMKRPLEAVDEQIAEIGRAHV